VEGAGANRQETDKEARVPHALDCAAAIRAHLADLDRHTVADEIVRCCAHHRLKAYRLAKGWTVQRAVDELAQIAHRDELNARGADERTWRRWENGGVRPDEDYQDRLSRGLARIRARLQRPYRGG
jgi:hypothetical protein